MGLVSSDFSEIQNLYLQYIEAKTTGEMWISYLIIKLWDTTWEIWKYRNHTLYSTYGYTKTDILTFTNKIITYHLRRGMTGLPQRFKFLFQTTIHTLISRPVHQRLSCMAATSSKIKYTHRWAIRKRHLHTDGIILERITKGCLIPSLTQFDVPPPTMNHHSTTTTENSLYRKRGW